VKFDLRHLVGGMVAAVVAMAAVAATPALAQNVPVEELAVQSPIGDIVLGAETAPVTIYEYASMTCPHCAAFHRETYAALKAEFIDTGQVRFIMREFPLEPFAAAGFLLARCSPGAEGYYGMIDLLFEQQGTWAGNYEALVALALQAGFTQATFDACLANQALIDGIYWTYDRGVEIGVNATPTFFVNGTRLVGELTIEQVRQAVAAAL
jgi:protein-disulfide isomerase